MNKATIKRIALDNGFKLKKQEDGTMDLNPYVYDFARALVRDGGHITKEDIETMRGEAFITKTE